MFEAFWKYSFNAGLSWNSTGKIGRIGRQRAEKPNVEVTGGLGPMPPDASDLPVGIPAKGPYMVLDSLSEMMTRCN